MPKLEWNQSDRFYSNNGAGPLTARILCVADNRVMMERWRGRTPISRRRPVRFDLSISYFMSERCGWKKCP